MIIGIIYIRYVNFIFVLYNYYSAVSNDKNMVDTYLYSTDSLFWRTIVQFCIEFIALFINYIK